MLRYKRAYHLIIFTMMSILTLMGSVTVRAGAQIAASDITARCRKDLAQRLGLMPVEITVKQTEKAVWNDASLGLSRPDMLYAQVITPGWRIILAARNTDYLYHTSHSTLQYGGPVSFDTGSVLYLAPIPDEPNLNGNLMQISLIGANPKRILEGVAAFFPQENGSIIAKRRTSRSGHDLIYLPPGLKEKPVVLEGAFDFGAASVNEKGILAVYIRRTLGGEWGIAIGNVKTGARGIIHVIPMMDGVRPDRLAWEGERLFAQVRLGEKTELFSTNALDEMPKWTRVTTRTFPGEPSLMLSKSQSLVAYLNEKNGVVSTRVVVEWFTGDQNDVATLPGFKFSHIALGPVGGFAFLTGTKEGRQVVYVVDLKTKEAISFALDSATYIEPFNFPPRQ